jgi:hypothetical protein
MLRIPGRASRHELSRLSAAAYRGNPIWPKSAEIARHAAEPGTMIQLGIHKTNWLQKNRSDTNRPTIQATIAHHAKASSPRLDHRTIEISIR